MNWIRRFFGIRPEAAPNLEKYRGPVIWSGCGFSFNGQQPSLCGRSECNTCYPMTRERAAVINERFLMSRKTRKQQCCGSCPGGCLIESSCRVNGVKP